MSKVFWAYWSSTSITLWILVLWNVWRKHLHQKKQCAIGNRSKILKKRMYEKNGWLTTSCCYIFLTHSDNFEEFFIFKVRQNKSQIMAEKYPGRCYEIMHANPNVQPSFLLSLSVSSNKLFNKKYDSVSGHWMRKSDKVKFFGNSILLNLVKISLK